MISKYKNKFLKNVNSGTVLIYTDLLADREDMIECDKKGNPVHAADKAADMSTISLKEQIIAMRKKSDLVDTAARFDISFAEGTKPKEMKELLIAELTKKQIIEPDAEEVEEEE